MQEMRERGIERNVHTFSALMNVCIKCGQYKLALDVYRDMRAAVSPPPPPFKPTRTHPTPKLSFALCVLLRFVFVAARRERRRLSAWQPGGGAGHPILYAPNAFRGRSLRWAWLAGAHAQMCCSPCALHATAGLPPECGDLEHPDRCVRQERAVGGGAQR